MRETFVHIGPVVSGVQTIALDRPPVNAVTIPVMDELAEAFVSLSFSDATVALFTGPAGRPFCAGADLKEDLDDVQNRRRVRIWRTVLSAMRQSPIPIIGAVGGTCVGLGLGLVSRCDLVLASESAKFGLPEIRVGRTGGAANLRRFVPERIVRRMVLTGEPLSAFEAHEAHLVDEVVPDEDWERRPIAFAESIAARGDRVVRISKRSLDESEFLTFEDGSALESKYADQLRDEGYWDSGPYRGLPRKNLHS